LIVGATFGALISDDNGATWRLVCEVPLGTVGQQVDPVYRVTKDGTLLVASPSGLLYSKDGGCSFATAGGSVAMQSLTDVAPSPTNGRRVLATSNTSGVMNGVHASIDGGATFSATLNMAGYIFRNVRFAPDGNRAYALAIDANNLIKLYRSEDAGASFTPTGFSVGSVDRPTLIGVSPTNSNLLYFYGKSAGLAVLYRSTDGGQSFQTVQSLSNGSGDGPLVGTIFDAAFTPDGTLYISTNQGVRKSVDGLTFTTPPDGAPIARCMTVRGGAVYACGDDTADGGFAIGKSNDDGATFTALMHYNGSTLVGPLQCGLGTQVCNQCYGMWTTFASQFSLPNTQAPACLPASAASGGGSGMSGGGSQKSSANGCQVASRTLPPAGIVLLPLAFLLFRRRRG
jgi:hypothetical protein